VERVADNGDELGGLLITRHLTFSQPYRSLFTGRSLPQLRIRLLDALAGLFVRLHLAGFYWGDCSLSNTLFRRDAGALAAYLVDAETGELHSRLTDGQRAHDIEIARTNIAGELFDLQAAGLLGDDVDVVDLANTAQSRYESLWQELTQDLLVPPGENYLINQRIRRLNDLGFDVSELTINTEPEGMRLGYDTQVVEAGHHQRRLFELTGLRVQENQARALLADLWRYKAKWEDASGKPVFEDQAARRWLDEKFYGVLALVPRELRNKLPDAELFHEISEHRWLLSEQSGHDVGRAAAVDDYVATVLRDLPLLARRYRAVQPPRTRLGSAYERLLHRQRQGRRGPGRASPARVDHRETRGRPHGQQRLPAAVYADRRGFAHRRGERGRAAA
jgi:hypothetical protein